MSREAPHELEEFGRAVTQLEPPVARESFRAQLRARLVATAQSEWSARRRRFDFAALFALPRYAMVVGAIVLVIVAAGGGVAAASSLPGDPAHGLKLAFEQAELAVALDDATKVEVMTRIAEHRLDELQRAAAAKPQVAPTATDAYRETVERLRAAVVALNAAPASERHEAARGVAAAAAAKHVAILEELKRRHDAPGIERALDRAIDETKELERRAGDEHEQRPRDGKPPERPRPGGTPTREQGPAPIVTPTPRPSIRFETPRPTEQPRIETPKPPESSRPSSR